MRILVIDDEAAIGRMLEKAFTVIGHDVVVRESAEAAINTLQNGNRFDLILTDVRMTGIPGTEFLRIAREMNFLNGASIIIMSGTPDEDVTKTCREFNALFLKKPFKSINYEVLPTIAEVERWRR